MLRKPRSPQLARSLLEALAQPTGLSKLTRQRLDPAHLGCDPGERARRIPVQLREPFFGGQKLCLRGSRPTVGMIGQHPQLGLGCRAAADDLTQVPDECELELVWKTAHVGEAETARSCRLALRLARG